MAQLNPNTYMPIDGVYSNINVSRSDAQAAVVSLFAAGGGDYNLLTRENVTITPAFNSLFSITVNITSEAVSYIYIDKDTAITATGSSTAYPLADIPINNFLDDMPFSITAQNITLTANDVNLSLKKGWNSVNTVFTIALTMNLSMEISGINGNIRASIGDPSSHKWTLNALQAP